MHSFWRSQLFTLGSGLVASACLWSLCSVNSGVTLRRDPNCVTALIFTHQSWAPNWYSPSLINALHCKSLTALRSLFILLCHSSHEKSRSDMSVMAHLNGGTLMTACVAFPLSNPPGEKQRGKNALGTTLYHKKLKAFHPSWPISTVKYVKWKWRLSGIVQNHHYDAEHQGYNCCDQGGHKHWLKVFHRLRTNTCLQHLCRI